MWDELGLDFDFLTGFLTCGLQVGCLAVPANYRNYEKE
jgi:hypothetical protein